MDPSLFSNEIETSIKSHPAESALSVALYEVQKLHAIQRLRQYFVKGFTTDDDRLNGDRGGNYFYELLARIRDIRSSD